MLLFIVVVNCCSLLRHVLEEMLQTEQLYVKDLKLIVEVSQLHPNPHTHTQAPPTPSPTKYYTPPPSSHMRICIITLVDPLPTS